MRRALPGIVLVEVLVSMAMMVVLMPALITAFFTARSGALQQSSRLSALGAVKEAQTAVRVVRDAGWEEIEALSEGTVYHPERNEGSWILVAGEESLDPLTNMTRRVELAPAYRDEEGNLVEEGGNPDPSVRRVEVTVSWGSLLPSAVKADYYLMRFENLVWLETLLTDFEEGELVGTAAVELVDGEVILGATGGTGDWCRPSDYIVGEVDLPQSGAARDVKALEGKAFTGTSQAGSGSFVELWISNDDPPNAGIESLMTGYQTNDVFIDGQYAYVATQDQSKDVVIFDLTTNTEVGYFNDTAWFGTAQGVYVVGNVGYVTIGLNLHTFDLSSKTGERGELDRVFLWGTGYRLMTVGNYTYVAMDLGSSELRLVNVSNPNNISLAAKANVNGARGQEVYVNETGTRAYLATSESGDKDEFFIINTDVSASNKNRSNYYLTVINSYNSNGMSPTGLTVVSGPRAIVVGTGGEEYQVIDITDETETLVKCGGLNVDSGIYGVSSVFTSTEKAYSYIVTGDSNLEFKIIEGGPGDEGGDKYVLTGTFESQILDVLTEAGSQGSAFNRFEAVVDSPSSVTGIAIQVAGGDPVSGSCTGAEYLYVGPDKTDETYFELDNPEEAIVEGMISGTIPWDDDSTGYENPARCFRYKAYLTTEDESLTPILKQFSLNYSP